MSEQAPTKALSICVLLLLAGCSRDETINSVRHYSHGTVTQVTSCNESKYSLNCWVRTDAWHERYDITGWPGDYVSVGDRLFWQDLEFDDRVETYKCRNDRCRLAYWDIK